MVDLSKISIKKIRELIVFTALLVVALWKFDMVLGVLKTIWGDYISVYTWWSYRISDQCANELFGKDNFLKKAKKENKIVKKLSRPISLLLTVVLVVGVISLVMFGVIPQLTRTWEL